MKEVALPAFLTSFCTVGAAAARPLLHVCLGHLHAMVLLQTEATGL